ncbi:cell wall-binding repeat-containing protein [Microbacterium gorillae]|uniref:cell wall-binding repeat-containing protein n=1 Tax=Microbacterium gorillae TaxID=1231063 RepID=UPI0006949DE2|nr:cell wall-binding repeat-containing protein [Microbacterium gorillae]
MAGVLLTAQPAAAAGTTRLAGADRYATAVAVSQRYAAPVPVVFLATGTQFPDALSAAAAASALGGPLLLTPTAAVPDNVLAEVRRLQPQRIHVVGGTGAVSAKAVNQLKAIAPTDRWGDVDRYATGLKIVQNAFADSAPTSAVIATGRSFPDALAATGGAALQKAPVVLVDGMQSRVPNGVIQTLKSLGVRDVTIAGGEGAVSASIANQLSASFAVTRQGGPDRYDTAVRLNEHFFGAVGATSTFLATGANFPDALAGAALAGSRGAAMYITRPDCLPESVSDSMHRLGGSSTTVLGGPGVVSDAAASGLRCLTSAAPSISGSPVVGETVTANTRGWTADTTFTYSWAADGATIGGAKGATLTVPASAAGKRLTVTVRGSNPGYVSVTRTSGPSAMIGTPDRTSPLPDWSCPSWAPIKGNADSMLYHVPGGAFYDRTKPEECFATEAAARAAGYTRSKR